ncbi:(2,3-dihydroxybenzoyl)adenylate synthase [Bailinhaonella thermotolerans]|uniref:2,3-dihydroxybenzoate-AMP ligase n=1 Tax=Bailinhaonella thermotolerans TaxID=1070861 RepID=A0A3A4AL64_9ACTN|nr:(2,3-dihydroxybenzoyl)adenylate synthase [Bailinhaonella thermotolerans]RJL27237.1 2,3-dihydroxybenzoate-AMP ligase [Bailinhaonella thermotolerans]
MIEYDRVPEDFAERYRRAGYWRGETLGGLLRDWAARDGGRIAVVDEAGSHGYAALDAWADRLAAGFRALGAGPGRPVVVQLPNVAAFAAVSVALFRAGAPPVFALPTHRRSEISYLCEASEAVAYVIPDVHHGFDHRALAGEVLASAKTVEHVIVAGDPGGEFLALGDVERAPEPIMDGPRPDDVAFFLLSGGTTGLPKLIPRTHDDYAYQLRATAEGLEFGEDGVYLAVLPVAHNAALGCPGLLGALRAGGRAVLLTSPSPDEAFPLIESQGVTLTTLMPPLVTLWLEAAEFYDVDFSRLLVQVGSARFAPETARRVTGELGARLTHWFGMAEGLLTYTRLDDPEDVVIHTQGRPLSPADEIRVVDEHDRDVPPGEIGELLTRGPYTLRGYYRVPEHNARAFTPDGFLRTGDLVRLTPRGDMVVEGRVKDVINRGGEKVAAGEVEDLLVTHPAVREAAVVAMPDAVMGERACAFVVPRGAPPALEELRSHLRGQGLADYKLPDRLELIGALPLTKVGKVDKAALRGIAAGSA